MSYLSAPADHAVAVTPHATNLIGPCRALFVGGAGNVTLDTAGGETDVLFSNVQAGAILPVRAIRVKISGTSATGIVALS